MTRLGLNLNYLADGSFVGGALSGSNRWDSFNHGNLDRETSFRLGLNFDHTGSYTGTSTKLGLKNHFGDYDHDVHHEAGVGLTFHKAGNYDLELSSMVSADQNQQTGFYGWGAGVSGVWNFKPGGQMSGSSQNVDLEFRFQTEAQMQERYDQHQRRLAEYEAEEERYRQMWTQMFKDGVAVAYNSDPQAKGAGSASADNGTETFADVFTDDETIYAKAGFFDRFSQRLGNVFNTDCWLCTHKGVIENTGNRDGALAELRKIQELGYELTPQQNLLKNTLERIQTEKAALLAQCGCEGFIDPLKISQNMGTLSHAAREKYRALVREELIIERQHSEVIFNYRWAGEDSVGLTPYNQKLYYDFFEGRLTRDHLRDVTLHDGFFSWLVPAGAWTIGTDIYRADSAYRKTPGGFNQLDEDETALIAHELTHHIQQQAGGTGYFWRHVKEWLGSGSARYDHNIQDERDAIGNSLPDVSDPSKPLERWAELIQKQYYVYEASIQNNY